jgi:hypothetical protein
LRGAEEPPLGRSNLFAWQHMRLRTDVFKDHALEINRYLPAALMTALETSLGGIPINVQGALDRMEE